MYGPPEAVPKALLFRRFELTIPRKVPVIVHHFDIMMSREMRTIGVPTRIAADILFLSADERYIAIPKALVINIQSVF